MADPISTTTFPGDDISPEAIGTEAASIRFVGQQVASQAISVTAAWRRLSDSYQAPEADALLEAISPVKTEAATFGRQLGRAAAALDTFAVEARDIKRRLEGIRTEANLFLGGIRNGTVETYKYTTGGAQAVLHISWDEDPATVARNNALISQVDAQAAQLQAAELRCADAIRKAAGQQPATPRPGGHHPDASRLPEAERPWGRPAAVAEDCGARVARRVEQNIMGGLQGTVALAGWTVPGFDPSRIDEPLTLTGSQHSWDTAGDAWKATGMWAAGFMLFGLAGTGVSPPGVLLPTLPGPVGDFFRRAQDSAQTTAKNSLTELVAADMWADDWRAASGVTAINLAALALGSEPPRSDP